jgi:hypothetical protein
MHMAGLQVEVKMTELDVVQELCQVLIDMSKDERIPIPVRDEMMDRVNGILER